jgi:hypothetical protein
VWQDFVIASAQLAFLLAMIPTLLGPDKPALLTSLSTAFIVSIVAVTQLTLSLWFTFLVATLHAMLWALLAIQKFTLNTHADNGQR